jgi:hypothetical protein
MDSHTESRTIAHTEPNSSYIPIASDTLVGTENPCVAGSIPALGTKFFDVN